MLGKQLIGLTFPPICLISIICNWSVFFVTCRIRSLSPSFALLTGCLALFDGCFSIVFLGYVGPMIVLDSKFLKKWSHECGFALMIFYDAAINIHLLISLNRFFAVYTPILYRRLFDLSLTRIYTLIFFSYSLTALFIYRFLGCTTYYNDDLWMFYLGEESETCITYSWITDYAKDLVVAYFNAFIDVVTILKVHLMRKQVKQSKSNSIRKKEMDFLKQTCVQGFVSLLTLTMYQLVPEFITNIYLSFMMTTFLWPNLSMTDGVAVLIYNSEIRGHLFGRKLKESTSSIRTISVSERKSSLRRWEGRYYDIPQYAIHVGKNEFHSVGTCHKLGAHYGCTESKNKQCPMVTVATPETVYTKEVDDMTFIKHPKYKLGNAKHSVPANGAFLISFPDTEKLRIASIEIQECHMEHFIQHLTTPQTHPDVTHDDVYQAVQNGYMTEEEANVIHGGSVRDLLREQRNLLLVVDQAQRSKLCVGCALRHRPARRFGRLCMHLGGRFVHLWKRTRKNY